MSRIPVSFLATASLAASLAALPPTIGAQTAPPQKVEVVGAASAAPAEARGRYALEDGRTLEIAVRGRTLHADLDGRPTTVLHPLDAAQYASADGRLRVRLQVHHNGLVGGLVLTEWRGDTAVRTASR